MAEEYELKQVRVRLKLAEAEPLYSTESISTPNQAVKVMADALAQMDREYCCAVNLDGSIRPINFNIVSIGDINQAYVPIQNVFKAAILSNASGIILFHNHPSGSLKASREDIEITNRLIDAGKLMNVQLMDHIIVAGGTAEYYSFREKHPEMFEGEKRRWREGSQEVKSAQDSWPEQTVTFTVAECGEFHGLGEMHEGIQTLEEAVRIYDRLCRESLLHAIPALGINLHTAGEFGYEDAQWDFLSGGRLDLEGLDYLPEMKQNGEVMEALHRIAEMYPDAEITGQFPDGPGRTVSVPAHQKTDKEKRQEHFSVKEKLAEIKERAGRVPSAEKSHTQKKRRLDYER